MKTIGLIGGMSWESSIIYYEVINTRARDLMGGLHSARSVMFSFDFAEVETLQRDNRWDLAGDAMAEAARSVERAGADFLVICTNTMHITADAVEDAVSVPLLHIAEPTANLIEKKGLERIGLLGTAFTMEKRFYKERLLERHGLDLVVPNAVDRQDLHRIIYEELCQGVVSDASRRRGLEIIAELTTAGVEGVILGCTELTLLIEPEECPVPLFDTTRIHAETAVDVAISDETAFDAIERLGPPMEVDTRYIAGTQTAIRRGDGRRSR